jgi:CelD/BcsL family acetyltransferase involved in cellulose biosynthesis
MQAQLLPASAIDSSVLGEWLALSSRAAEPNPWFEPHVVMPLAAIRNDIALLVVRGRERFHACVPLVPATHTWLKIPLAMWLTPHPMGTPLVEPEGSEDALRCAFTYLSRARGPRFIKLQEIRAEGPVTSAVTRALATGWRHTAVSQGVWPMVRRRPGDTYVEEAIGRKQRLNLGRMRRRLEEQLGGELTLTDRAGDAAAVDRFLQLEASGWKGRQGTAMACLPGWPDYFHKVCSGFASEGRLRVLCLEAGATTVAMKVMTRAGEGLFEIRIAYDERFSRFSPGVLLELAALRHFHEGRASWAISNTNSSTTPLGRIWPDSWEMISILAECPGAGRQAVAGLVSRLGSRAHRHAAPAPALSVPDRGGVRE